MILEGEVSGEGVHNKPREAQGAARVAVAGDDAELMLRVRRPLPHDGWLNNLSHI